jgi:osomolarity two-component system phosphorelay intermediate protein YPD1
MAADGPPKSDAPPPKSDAAPPPLKDAKADKPKAPEPEPEDPPADSEARVSFLSAAHRAHVLQPINMDIFGQILELDEDDTFEFSKEMVEAYFSQASTTFDDMDNALYVPPPLLVPPRSSLSGCAPTLC